MPTTIESKSMSRDLGMNYMSTLELSNYCKIQLYHRPVGYPPLQH